VGERSRNPLMKDQMHQCTKLSIFFATIFNLHEHKEIITNIRRRDLTSG
jgi:hypothetical protein